MHRLLLCLAATAAVMVSTATAAQAQFAVCNRSSVEKIDVAFGSYSARSGWEAQGWYPVRPGQCATIIDRALGDRAYYLYAEAGDRVWDGAMDGAGADFCLRRDGVFKLNSASVKDEAGNLACEKHGYETKRYFRVDTQGASEHKFEFVD